MVGGEDGKTRGHAAHWEKGGEPGGRVEKRWGVLGVGVRWGRKQRGWGGEVRRGRRSWGQENQREREKKRKKRKEESKMEIERGERGQERDKKRKERRGNRKGENELQGFYRKLQKGYFKFSPN